MASELFQDTGYLIGKWRREAAELPEEGRYLSVIAVTALASLMVGFVGAYEIFEAPGVFIGRGLKEVDEFFVRRKKK